MGPFGGLQPISWARSACLDCCTGRSMGVGQRKRHEHEASWAGGIRGIQNLLGQQRLHSDRPPPRPPARPLGPPAQSGLQRRPQRTTVPARWMPVHGGDPASAGHPAAAPRRDERRSHPGEAGAHRGTSRLADRPVRCALCSQPAGSCRSAAPPPCRRYGVRPPCSPQACPFLTARRPCSQAAAAAWPEVVPAPLGRRRA